MYTYCFLAGKNDQWDFINTLLSMGKLCISAYICNLEIEPSYINLNIEGNMI